MSRTVEGAIHRCTYGDIHGRSKQAAKALPALGVLPGERIATLAWNGYRHMELYFGVSGMGAVLHTINPRLFPEQIEYIVNHAEDQYLFFDLTFVPLLEKLAPLLKTVKGFVAMTDRAHMPAAKIPHLLCYEELVGAQDDDYAWPVFDENAASSLCYTSGTTGHPKGVLYSHRSTVLHSYAVCAVDGLRLSAAECALLVVPMFHVNAWGTPYAGAMCGAKLVMPGPALDGKSVYELMKDEKVTLALGVPTVWLMLFKHVEAAGLDPRKDLVLKRVVIGGSAAPRAMSERFERQFGTFVVHAWGMTEMSPLGTICNLLPKHADLTPGRSGSTCRESRDGRSTASSSGSPTTRAAGCRTTARPSATCWCEGPGSRPATSRARAGRSSTPTASSTPATSRRSTPTATCRSPTGRRT